MGGLRPDDGKKRRHAPRHSRSRRQRVPDTDPRPRRSLQSSRKPEPAMPVPRSSGKSWFKQFNRRVFVLLRTGGVDGVWSSAFQHQFLDGNLRNFSAAPGTENGPTISFEAPEVRPTPPPEARGFPVRRGNRFSYAFAPGTFPRIIGIDIKLDIAFPSGAAAASLAGNVVLQNNDTARLLLGFSNGNARLQLVVNNQFHAAIAQFDPAAPLRIQAR